jgi:predicted nucleic-acid-binding protein
MKVSLDTNVLVRLIVGDDEAQQTLATKTLESAELVTISVHAICEFAWVLQRAYKIQRPDIATAIRGLLNISNVVVSRPIIEAGLAVLESGGDFADGVISFDGQWLGADTFLSFDRQAVSLISKQGYDARLLG